MLLTNATGTLRKKTLGPSGASGCPQQKRFIRTMPPTGTAASTKAALPLICSPSRSVFRRHGRVCALSRKNRPPTTYCRNRLAATSKAELEALFLLTVRTKIQAPPARCCQELVAPNRRSPLLDPAGPFSLPGTRPSAPPGAEKPGNYASLSAAPTTVPVRVCRRQQYGAAGAS
jgi:hypothetical protein